MAQHCCEQRRAIKIAHLAHKLSSRQYLSRTALKEKFRIHRIIHLIWLKNLSILRTDIFSKHLTHFTGIEISL